MDTAAMQTFSALLAVGALVGSVVMAVGLVFRPAVLDDVVSLARSSAARFVLLLAGTSMLGSLYFSEVAHYAPCKLCWYQRICMYSIAVMALVAVVLATGLVSRPEDGSGLADVVSLARTSAARFVLLLAGTSMLGSLYFSEVAHYAPCKLCWYQRICMYSIAVMALVAVVRRESFARVRVLAPYVLVLSLVGLCISTYHYLLEWFPQLESNVCSLDVPCTTVWFRKFGFVTLPGMAWAAFAGVALVMVSVLHPPPPADANRSADADSTRSATADSAPNPGGD